MTPHVLRIKLDRRLFGDRSRKRTVVLAASGRLVARSHRSIVPNLLQPPAMPTYASHCASSEISRLC
jgi:hypothetical protein